MRLLISITVVVLLAIVLLAGCNSNELTASKNKSAPCTPSPGGEPRRITPAEVKNELASGAALLIDVRGEGAYKTSHIKGSKQIPYAEIANHSDELPHDKLIVTYCSWPNEHTSAGAVLSLKTKCIDNAAAVLGGFEAMKNAGFEVVTGLDPNGGDGH